jgi:hypothetical protein
MWERSVPDRCGHVGAGQFIAATYLKAHHLIIYGMDINKQTTEGILILMRLRAL